DLSREDLRPTQTQLRTRDSQRRGTGRLEADSSVPHDALDDGIWPDADLLDARPRFRCHATDGHSVGRWFGREPVRDNLHRPDALLRRRGVEMETRSSHRKRPSITI